MKVRQFNIVREHGRKLYSAINESILDSDAEDVVYVGPLAGDPATDRADEINRKLRDWNSDTASFYSLFDEKSNEELFFVLETRKDVDLFFHMREEFEHELQIAAECES